MPRACWRCCHSERAPRSERAGNPDCWRFRAAFTEQARFCPRAAERHSRTAPSTVMAVTVPISAMMLTKGGCQAAWAHTGFQSPEVRRDQTAPGPAAQCRPSGSIATQLRSGRSLGRRWLSAPSSISRHAPPTPTAMCRVSLGAARGAEQGAAFLNRQAFELPIERSIVGRGRGDRRCRDRRRASARRRRARRS